MIDAPRLMGWAEGAPAGASLTLGRGDRLPPSLGRAVNLLAAAGVIAPARRRDSDGRFSFMAQRCSAAMPTSATLPPPQRRTGAQVAVQRAILSDIRRGRACRTNAELAADLDLSRSAVAWAVRQIVADGRLQFDHHGPLERRVAIDTQTGSATPRSALPARRRRSLSGGWLSASGLRR